jgi:hypothetical protein
MAAILPGDLTHSWIFRPAVSVEADTPAPEPAPSTPVKAPEPRAFAVEYRPMSCRFDRMARIPEAVWAEPGTSRLER